MNALQERPEMETCYKPPASALRGKKQQKQNSAALYLRLSREDDDTEDESISIGYQRKMLQSYAREKGFNVYKEYVDEGKRGVTFDRPKFKDMLKDIRAGQVNVVLVKDLSRFGRNYSESSYYIDEFFPDHNVRLIAIDGSYDGASEDNEYAPFANFFNEYFSRQTSKKMKKTRRVAAQSGQYMGSIPPYGYRRSDVDTHKLVVDEEAASVVRRIFELFRNGDSMRYIADTLNCEGVLPPQAYYFSSVNKKNPYEGNAKTWCSATISAILKRDTYIGHITQGKKRVKSFKDKKIIFVPEEEWITRENMHEAIIDLETFNTVQLLFSRNRNSKPRRTAIGNEPSLFSNLLRCKECGAKLNFNTWNRRGRSEHFYRCSKYIQHKDCTPHRISLELLTKVVLADIQFYARLADDDEEAFVRQLSLISQKDQAAIIDRHRKHIAGIKDKLKKIDGLMCTAFEKLAGGVLSDAMFNNITSRYQQEKDAIEAELPTLTAALKLAESRTADISEEVANLRRFAKVTELTREVVTNLIKAIHISEPVRVGKHKEYDIEIEYRFNNPRSIPLKTCYGLPEDDEVVENENTSFGDEVSSDSSKAVCANAISSDSFTTATGTSILYV